MKSRRTLIFLFLSIVVAGIGALRILPAYGAGENLVPNPSLASSANGTTPDAWTSGRWGTNTATFQYLNTGRTDARSVRTEITNYTDGDAKWFFQSVNITPGKTYNFSDYYKSNATTEAVVRYTNQDGSFSYAVLGDTPSSTSVWKQTAFTFTAPSTARQATVFHIVSSVGWLILDDASLNEQTTPPPTGANLVPNPSVEQSSASNPTFWTKNKWGTNTANFSYLTTGHTGNRSVKSEITNYTDGDAKWYFQPINVASGKSYNFSDYYKSNTTTQVIVQYTSDSGSQSYEWLGTVASSSEWAQANFSFITPSNTRQVSVFHIVSSIGSLTIDDISLTERSGNPIPNPSLELPNATDPSQPDGWTPSTWGQNTSNFQWVNGGRTGNKSVKVTVSNHVDGDAKWFYEPQALERGKTYHFTAWYKTNTIPKVAVLFTKDDGTELYPSLRITTPGVNAATEWQKYTDTFTVPIDVKNVSVFLYLPHNGWVQTDDYSIDMYQPTGFNRPLVTLTFDDGYEENNTTALPRLNANGFKSTQCFISQPLEDEPDSRPNVLEFYNSGHEICSHTVSHPFLTELSPSQRDYELSHSQDFLEDLIGHAVPNFASPYGDYNAAVNNNIRTYYRSHRTVDVGYNSKDNLDLYRVKVQNLNPDITIEEYKSWLANAEANKTWLVLVYHKVTTSSDLEPFDTRVADFDKQMAALKASGLTVKTYNAALDEITPQL